jgi:hypothetical protein
MKLFVLLLVILLFVLWKKNQTRQKTWGERLQDTLKEGLFKKDPLGSKNPEGSRSNSDTFNATNPNNSNKSNKGDMPVVDELIACAVCGLHTPKSHLVLGKNHQYQCAKHS